MKHAIILAGGRGERLRPLTEGIPKSMVPIIDDKPLIWWMLHWLRSQGVLRATICCGYLYQVITDYVADGAEFNVQVDYVVENEPLGRGGAIKAAMKKIGSQETLLALNGDLITTLDIRQLAQVHEDHRMLATVVGTPLISPYGILDIDADRNIIEFKEKPRLPYWMNAGIYALSPAIIDFLPDRGDHEVESFPLLAKEKKLRAYLTEHFWKTVDTVKDLSELRSFVQENMHNWPMADGSRCPLPNQSARQNI